MIVDYYKVCLHAYNKTVGVVVYFYLPYSIIE